MAESVLDIWNRAFILVGSKRAMAEDEDKKPARTATELWPGTRDSVLGDHPWKSIRSRQKISPNATKPDFEWDNQFDWPADCIRPLIAWRPQGQPKIDWTVEGHKILANTTTLYLIYNKREEDVTVYDPNLIDCLGFRLASDLAIPLAGSSTLSKDLFNVYLERRNNAKFVSANMGDGDRTEDEIFDEDDWTASMG